jgi:Fe2+ transport system protein FeoA
MHMSETAIGTGAATTLDRLPVGRPAEVLEVGPDHAVDLLREGLLPGAPVAVRSTAPLGGPVIVEIGRATIAVGRRIAASVRVAPQTQSEREPEAEHEPGPEPGPEDAR